MTIQKAAGREHQNRSSGLDELFSPFTAKASGPLVPEPPQPLFSEVVRLVLAQQEEIRLLYDRVQGLTEGLERLKEALDEDYEREKEEDYP